MEGVSNEYISSAVDQLTIQLGVKEPVVIPSILKPLRAGDIKECTQRIAAYLGLPVEVNVSHVLPMVSTGLATTDCAGRGVGGITAQVSIPSYLPFYGTPGLEKFPIFVKVSENCLKYPSTFAAIMAHELSHIVLHSLQHKERDNEFYADLTAMVLGFSRVMKDGRKVKETQIVDSRYYVVCSQTLTQTTTTTYGYLTDSQFKLAFDKIGGILKKYRASCQDSKQRLRRKVTDYENEIRLYRQQLSKLDRFMKYVDRDRTTRMSQEDTARIIALHQPGYFDRLTSVLSSNEGKCKQIHHKLPLALSGNAASHYTTRTVDSLQSLCNEVDGLLSSLEQECVVLRNDIAVMKKHVAFWARL